MLPIVIRRACPACRSSEFRVLGTIEAGEICASNHTYHRNALEILGLESKDEYPIVECKSCGFVFALFLPDPVFLETLYTAVIDKVSAAAQSNSPLWLGHQLRLVATLLERSGEASGVRLLDYGCGTGAIIRALRGSRISCTGFDPFSSEVDSDGGREIVRSVSELHRLAPFDAILFSDVLEHVADPLSVLDECRDLLVEGGWMCISVPDFSSGRLAIVMRALAAGVPVTAELNPWEHLNYFSPRSLAQLVGAAGFAIDMAASATFGFRPDAVLPVRIGNFVKSSARMFRFAVKQYPTSTTLYARRAKGESV